MSARIVPIARARCGAEPCQAGRAACPTASACQVPQAEPQRRASALASAFTLWKRCVLRFKISSSERYLATCEAEGITQGRSIDEWKRQLAEQRMQLDLLEGRA